MPDAEWHLPNGNIIGIEVELHVKRRDELWGILTTLIKGKSDPDLDVDYKSLTPEEQDKWIRHMFEKRGAEMKRQMAGRRYAPPPQQGTRDHRHQDLHRSLVLCNAYCASDAAVSS